MSRIGGYSRGTRRWGRDRPNPLLSRLTGKPTLFSLRAARWLAFGVGLIGLALTSAVLLNARDAIGPLAFLPFSLIAATLTVRDTHSESYELLTATDISDTLPATTVPLPTWLVAF